VSIELVNVSKSYRTVHGVHSVYRNFNLRIDKGDSVGVIGHNGAGKSTLLKLISGAEKPDAGEVRRGMSVSWPLAFTGFFQLDLTGTHNAMFAARLYRRDPKKLVAFVREYSGLGKFMDWPVKGYSTGMRAKLGFALSIGIRFDCLLIDEVLSVGDVGFREKAAQAIEELRRTRSVVMVTHNLKEVMRMCNRVVLIRSGMAPTVSDNVKDTVKRFYYDMTGKPADEELGV
jgi:capsular polysaccharide transport system ATP-binding protein